jgi:hypothetical protein
VFRGRSEATLRWEDEFLDGLVTSSLLRYLAVAHYGRGRGTWTEGEYPPHWRPMVVESVVAERERLEAVWAGLREAGADDERMARELEGVLRELALDLLERLYPGALGDAGIAG